jgi:hypothetical protein
MCFAHGLDVKLISSPDNPLCRALMRLYIGLISGFDAGGEVDISRRKTGAITQRLEQSKMLYPGSIRIT